MHLSRKVALQAMFVLYGLLGLLSALIYRTLPEETESRDQVPAAPLRKSKKNIYTLAALFSLDALGSGFVVQSMLALWLFQKIPVIPHGGRDNFFLGRHIHSALLSNGGSHC